MNKYQEKEIWKYNRIDNIIDKMEEEIVETLKEFVKIPSVNDTPASFATPYGLEIRRALDFFMAKCSDFGLNTYDADGHYGIAETAFGNKTLGIFGHLDVVPSGGNWSVPPFSGVIVDGRMISRGTMDDKGPLVSTLFALKALKDENLIPQDVKIRLFFGCNEESGFGCIREFLKRDLPPDFSLVIDGNFPVTFYEKGIFQFNINIPVDNNQEDKIRIIKLDGGEKLNIVAGYATAIVSVPNNLESSLREVLTKFPYGDKIVLKKIDDAGSQLYEITATGVKVHSSVATAGQSAISILLNYLAELDICSREAFTIYRDKIGMSFSGEGIGIAAFDEDSGRLTANPGKLSCYDSSSQNKMTLKITFDVRYPVTTNGDMMKSSILNAFQSSPVDIEIIKDTPPLMMDKEGFLVKTLLSVYNDFTGKNEPPVAMGGNTYAHRLPNAVAFGPNHPRVPKAAHMADESVPIKDLINNTKIYARAIFEVANGLAHNTEY